MRRPRRRAHRTAAAAAVVLVLGGCAVGSGSEDGSVDRSRAETSTTSARADVADARRAEIVATLDAALACWNTECTKLGLLRKHSQAVLAAIVPLDDALRGTPASKAELERLATATSSLRHAALELQSCFLLSARKHDGTPVVAECYAPAGRFREDLEYARNALRSAS